MTRGKDELYPVELRAPDISRWRQGNTGIPYMTTLDSGKPGPHAMVNAVTHGNELCGALAIEFLDQTGFKPARGRVTLGFANIAAFAAFDPTQPGASRYVDEDFNRVWDVATLDGPRHSAELERAREIRPLIGQVDYLLDIHSMQHATAPLMLAGMRDKGVELAVRVGEPEFIVRDQGHAAGRRMRDYGGFDDPASPKAALLVECGQHWEAASFTVARDVTLRFLACLDLLDPAYAARHLPKSIPPRPRVIEVTQAVTIETNSFSFVEPFQGQEVIAKTGTVIGHDGGREIRTPYDDCVLIMPSRRLAKGQTAVRLGRFVA
ncbi:MAG: succinylglutamate desuccinylase [Rhodospirillales bacterium]|nr:succinylglutamate desuccinylase [Rhodospirillales bacterium]